MKKEDHKYLAQILSVIFISYVFMVGLSTDMSNITGFITKDITNLIPPNTILSIIIGIILFTMLIMNIFFYQWKNTLESEVKLKTNELQDAKGEVKQKNSKLKKIQKELNQKIKELEKFNKLAVGRELKMIELKKRIRELKEKSQFGKLKE